VALDDLQLTVEKKLRSERNDRIFCRHKQANELGADTPHNVADLPALAQEIHSRFGCGVRTIAITTAAVSPANDGPTNNRTVLTSSTKVEPNLDYARPLL
jgi:hypothetical protein